jgi:carbon storage regulator
MLIWTRREAEAIVIGDGITVTAMGTKGGQVREGIQAPLDVPVHREKVWERINKPTAS